MLHNRSQMKSAELKMQKVEFKIQARLTLRLQGQQESSKLRGYQYLFAHQPQRGWGSSLDPTSDLQVLLTLKIIRSVYSSGKNGFDRE